MSFGYSAGDAILLVQLAWKTLQDTIKACGEHDELTREVSSLHKVLKRLHSELDKPDSLLNRPDDDRKQELREIGDGCERILNVMNSILTKYNALGEDKRSGKKLWQKVRFGNGEMQDLSEIRLKLSAHTSAILMVVNLCSLGSQGRVEAQLNSVGGDLEGIRGRVDWIAANMAARSGEGTVWTSYANDDKALWKELRSELNKEGYDSTVLRKHRRLIKKYVQELGDRGLFDQVQDEERDEEDDLGGRDAPKKKEDNVSKKHNVEGLHNEEAQVQGAPENAGQLTGDKAEYTTMEVIMRVREDEAQRIRGEVRRQGREGMEDNKGRESTHSGGKSASGPTQQALAEIPTERPELLDSASSSQSRTPGTPPRSTSPQPTSDKGQGSNVESWKVLTDSTIEHHHRTSSDRMPKAVQIEDVPDEHFMTDVQGYLSDEKALDDDKVVAKNSGTDKYQSPEELPSGPAFPMTPEKDTEAPSQETSHENTNSNISLPSNTNPVPDSIVPTYPAMENASIRTKSETASEVNTERRYVLQPNPNDKVGIIKFKDAVGRKFAFPFTKVRTWAGMEATIRHAFMHVEVIGPHVAEGHYDLIGPNGEIILPLYWEDLIQPNWAVTMHMWPIPGGRHGTPRPQPRPPMQHRQHSSPPPPPPPGWPPAGGPPPSTRPPPVLVMPSTSASPLPRTKAEPAKGVLGWMAGSKHIKATSKRAKKL